MKNKQIVETIIVCLGGEQNIVSVTNCMTRLRVVVKNEALVDEGAIKAAKKVLGLVHDREFCYEIVVGPGNSRKFADICYEMGLSASRSGSDDRKDHQTAFKAGAKNSRVKEFLKIFGDIFVPLIPGIIAAGLCAGFAALITQLIPDYKDNNFWYLVQTLLSMINGSFMTFITAWAGYRAAERFGATPILGGMLGMITSLADIDTISQILGLFNSDSPLQSVLRSGKGGVLAVICGVFILSVVEKKIRKKMPASLDIVFTPLLTLVICAIPYILIIMPALGYVSNAIVWVFSQVCMSEIAVVRLIAGYAASALFLPLVASGMHHGLVALYTVQLQEIGFVTLYPALAMAGAGQVGAAIALYRKAKRLKHKKLCSVIGGALPAGILGVGEPLIYGVTLPMGRPFITAGLGAGFGGAFVMFCQVASTTWGPSGLLGVFVMTAGPKGAVNSMVMYLIGLVISCVMSYIITKFVIRDQEVEEALGGIDSNEEYVENTLIEVSETDEKCHETDRRIVSHGDRIFFGTGLTAKAGKRIETDTESVKAKSSLSVSAVADGELIAMSEIPDPVFSDGTMGECFGIMPSNGNVYSPVEGTVILVAETGHAIGIRSESGEEFLIHAGIDTVSLGHKAFAHYVSSGAHVKKDQLLMTVDLEMVKTAALSPVIIVIALN